MNEKEKMQPKVRFREFTGENAPDWEQRKLGEIANMHARIGWQNLRTSEFLDSGEYMLITGTDFQDGKIDYSKVHYVEKERYEQDKKIQILNGSILITKDGTIGKVAYVENLPMKATLNAGVFNLTVVDDINTSSLYLYHYLKGPFLLRFVNKESTGGTIKHLNQNVLVKFPIPLPSYREQLKISSFLTNIDKLITLHQRKLEQLEQLKNTLLSKMFPKSGTNIPEIRFSGFTDAWKQRKLEYFLEVSNEKNTDNLYSKENVLSVSGDFGVVNQIEFQGRSFAGVSVTNYGVLNTGDVVYTKSPLKANPYGIIKTNKGQPGIVSSLYGIYHTKEITVADFVQIYFEQNARLNNYLRPLVNKGAKNTILISDTEALKGRVCFAPTYEEQYIIATLFNHLDKLITFHQRNLDNLKNMKKTLLNKMFI
ncbi:restriction endonuclease subunit S [Enterococcus cecorum]|uniref:restriction endonuclease subunit S n=1 Tax=Enterococcus cecorum TaxID=44008 RepID=UPI0022CFC2C8|nr:restriction endonuclease subunit S [Enterococcus cecorum]MDZ5582289.1 restriction endonuclease subunit S [Enterococcus cecorum]CAI3339300.1 restriction endonuclease subunit S [Enterococcus cecorum]